MLFGSAPLSRLDFPAASQPPLGKKQPRNHLKAVGENQGPALRQELLRVTFLCSRAGQGPSALCAAGLRPAQGRELRGSWNCSGWKRPFKPQSPTFSSTVKATADPFHAPHGMRFKKDIPANKSGSCTLSSSEGERWVSPVLFTWNPGELVEFCCRENGLSNCGFPPPHISQTPPFLCADSF